MLGAIVALAKTPILGVISGVIEDLGGDERHKAKLMSQALKNIQDGSSNATELALRDAMSQDKFRTRWRPSFGWSMVVAFWVAVILIPVSNYCLVLYYFVFRREYLDTSFLPGVPEELLWVAVAGLLGTVGSRTVEKLKGIA